MTAALLGAFPILATGQPESEFYAAPKTAPEFWRAARFEIRTGNYERAAERIKGLLDLNPDSKTLFDLMDKPPPGTEGGMAPFLRLRNVPRWYANDKLDKEAKARVEELIGKISKAVEAELSNPDRIRRFANALAGPPEEAAFALNEIRRSGKAAVPVIATILAEKADDEVRVGILAAIPELGEETVPGFVGYLAGADANTQADLIDALRRRADYRSLPLSAQKDPVPTLWYLHGKPASPDAVKTKTRAAIVAATLEDPERERDPDLRTAHGRLTDFARRFYEGTSNLPKLQGDETQPLHGVWTWDGKALKETMLTRAGAAEHYGLRYAKWALDLQPDYIPAQKVFLGTAIEHHSQRAGGGRSLAATAPDLHAALATAPFSLLSEILEDSMRARKTSVVVAVVRVIGERTEPKAAQATARPVATPKKTGEPDLRPALLVKALDYPDPRVQFAAADALLRAPGPATHGRHAQIVKILAAAVAADPPEGAKQKVLLGDPDPIRADGVAAVFQRVGFDVEVARSGRDLMRRLHQKSDVDLIVLDHHIPDPLLRDLLAQLRGDTWGKTLPILVIASSEGITPVNLLTALARLAAVVAFEDLFQNPYFDFAPNRKDEVDRVLRAPEEMQRLIVGRHAAQVKRMSEAVEKAGFTLTEEMKDRIAYFSMQTFSPELIRAFAPQLAEEERIVVRRLLPPLVRAEAGDNPVAALKGRIRSDGLPSREQAERIVRLMKLTTSYEGDLPEERLAAFRKLWDSFWDPASPRLPPMEPVANPEIARRLARVAAAYRNVRVIPAVFTEEGFRIELAQATDPKAPLMTPAEKKENAKAAMVWLRKMAVGEVPGYRVADAEPAIRQALRSDDLAPLAIDALVKLPSREGQQDLANLAVAPERPIPIRTQAAAALVQHIQTFGKFVTGPQSDAIANSATAAENPELRARLLAAQGVMKSDAKGTGDRLKQYVPKPVEMKEDVPPPKEKEEPKVKEEKKD
jgi:CheY-like chemotaxis protein